MKTSTCIIRAVSKCEPKKASLLPRLNGPVQQLCRFRLCDVLFAQKSSPKSLCKCDKLALLLAQLNLWQPPKNVESILPRLCRFCNLMAAKHSYPATAWDLLLKLTRPPSFRYRTCIKQEPGTENIDIYHKSGLQMRTKKV